MPGGARRGGDLVSDAQERVKGGGGVLLDESRAGGARAASGREAQKVAVRSFRAVQALDRETAGDGRGGGERSGQGGAGQRLSGARGADERRPGAPSQGEADVVDESATPMATPSLARTIFM